MKQIKGCEHYYVTEDGCIYSTRRSKEPKLLKPFSSMGYLQVQLYGKSRKVHRLVAETFISNPYNFKYINHKDGNTHNNDVSNLEWCTQSYNVLHAYDTGLKQRKVTKELYDQIMGLKEGGMSYSAIAKKLGLFLNTVRLTHQGKINKIYGSEVANS